MKKVLSLIVAAAMICSLAIAVSATTSKDVIGDSDYVDAEVQVAGGNPPVAGAICFSLIRGVKFTFDIPDFQCGPSDEDPEAECGDDCVGVSWNSDPTSWKQELFCATNDGMTFEKDLSEFAWEDGEDGADGTGINWLKVAAASFVKGNDGTIKYDILGEGGKVLALGTACDNEDCSGTANCGPATEEACEKCKKDDCDGKCDDKTDGTNKDNTKVDTGVVGVALLGGIAVVAAGAVVLSRKRK